MSKQVKSKKKDKRREKYKQVDIDRRLLEVLRSQHQLEGESEKDAVNRLLAQVLNVNLESN
ncbi:MAG: hypothetical protein KME30_20985 [Iphinoe sp. HA4291-MV1]|nr:hypothetical protein [Iphinoe sp. HA4291-MV1]